MYLCINNKPRLIFRFLNHLQGDVIMWCLIWKITFKLKKLNEKIKKILSVQLLLMVFSFKMYLT